MRIARAIDSPVVVATPWDPPAASRRLCPTRRAARAPCSTAATRPRAAALAPVAGAGARSRPLLVPPLLLLLFLFPSPLLLLLLVPTMVRRPPPVAAPPPGRGPPPPQTPIRAPPSSVVPRRRRWLRLLRLLLLLLVHSPAMLLRLPLPLLHPPPLAAAAGGAVLAGAQRPLSPPRWHPWLPRRCDDDEASVQSCLAAAHGAHPMGGFEDGLCGPLAAALCWPRAPWSAVCCWDHEVVGWRAERVSSHLALGESLPDTHPRRRQRSNGGKQVRVTATWEHAAAGLSSQTSIINHPIIARSEGGSTPRNGEEVPTNQGTPARSVKSPTTSIPTPMRPRAVESTSIARIASRRHHSGLISLAALRASVTDRVEPCRPRLAWANFPPNPTGASVDQAGFAFGC